MRELIKDKKILILFLCIQLLTIASILKYMYNKKIAQENTVITRLSAEYQKTLSSKDDELDQIKKRLEKSAIANNTIIETNTSKKENTPAPNDFDIKDDKSIEKLIMDITDLLNNDEYSKILKYYNSDYVSDFKVTEEQIKDKMKFSPTVSAKITQIKRDSSVPDRAIVNVRLIDKKKAERMYDFTVFKDGSIADLPLYKEIELNKVMVKDDITYTLKKKFITRLGCIFVIHIDNKSEYLLDIQDIKGVLGSSTQYDHELINGNIHSYQITPEKSVDLIVKIFNEEKPDDIIFTNKRADGSIETYSIWNKS